MASSSVSATAYPIQIAIACMFRNAAFYLKDWLDFHLAVGVERFYLANNDSTDEYLSLLQPYLDKGVVELEHVYGQCVDQSSFEDKLHQPFTQRGGKSAQHRKMAGTARFRRIFGTRGKGPFTDGAQRV